MKLIPRKEYILKRKGDFCHVATVNRENYDKIISSLSGEGVKVMFVGTTPSHAGERNIFLHDDSNYIMFATRQVKNYCTPVEDIEAEIKKHEEEIERLKKFISW